ncbi:hypothetical protein BV25DRAFT_831039 [Artomyces pyxidatus]|uniref:Uncharacterized protein n=1 Tax=Artomyces pyxidatus TaxID=48021 RepID=A0ACB8SYW6_9AGAM|nr:hypothetical protein BV25DRAFT_831039 [Artomyces pyxidatus]
MSCYIPSQAGQEFDVRYRINDCDMSYTVYMDGRRMQGISVRKDCSYNYGKQIAIKGVHPSPDSYMPFRFSQIELTDDESVVDTGLDLDKLGTIEVLVHRIELFDPLSYWIPPKEVPVIGPVFEKSKKVGAHIVSLAHAQNLEIPLRPSRHKWVDEEGSPFVKFLFRYQSKDVLQAKGIIPRDSKQALVAEGSSGLPGGIKRSSSLEDQRDVKRVKRETSPIMLEWTTLDPRRLAGTREKPSTPAIPDDGHAIVSTVEKSVSPAQNDAGTHVGTAEEGTTDLTIDQYASHTCI